MVGLIASGENLFLGQQLMCFTRLFAINALLNTIHDRNSDRERALRDFKTP